LLAQIDPRTYQARLDQTEATLSHDQAHLENAQTNLQRYSELAKEKSTALERVSNQLADVDELNAQINLDQAAIDNAKAELSYTSLVAPFDGVTGFRGIIGIILLIGIVKKNGIMLVDFTLAGQRERGLSSGDAIHEACRLRFRPILMTTLCALLGGMLLMLGRELALKFVSRSTYAIVGGLLVSRLLTLFTMPIVYIYMDRVSGWLYGRSRSQSPEMAGTLARQGKTDLEKSSSAVTIPIK
jgi:AcrB/AcrD/AcrF family